MGGLFKLLSQKTVKLLWVAYLSCFPCSLMLHNHMCFAEAVSKSILIVRFNNRLGWVKPNNTRASDIKIDV
jgi:hypothetical protein